MDENEKKLLASFPNEPIPLILFKEEEEKSAENQQELIHVNEEAIDLLNQIQLPIAVVAIAGLYRTGKSSLLNWLVTDEDDDNVSAHGFKVGPTVERCTRGIWLWGKPKKRILANGKPGYVLILDTEGLGGLEASAEYDVRIFSLATLLCSKLIYNSQGSVDEKAVNGLSFIANMAKHIRIQSSTNDEANEGDGDLSDFLPSFMWVIRDFSLALVDEDGDEITSSEYLEKALAPQPGFSDSVRERNRVRQCLTSYFPHRDCVTLVRPVLDEELLQQQVSLLPISSLREEFQEQLTNLKQLLFEGISPKSLFLKPVNGPLFAGLIRNYVQSINSGSVPTIHSAWDGVTKTESRNAKNEGLALYREKLSDLTSSSSLPCTEEELNELLSNCANEALVMFRSRAVGEFASQYEEELKQEMTAANESIVEENRSKSASQCELLVQKLYADKIQPKFHDSSYTDMNQFLSDWTQAKQTYMKEARGVCKLEVFLTFTEVKHAEAVLFFLHLQEEKYETQVQQLEEEKITASQQLSLLNGREEVLKQQIETLNADLSGNLSSKMQLTAETEKQQLHIQELTEKLHQVQLDQERIAEEEKSTLSSKLNEEVKKTLDSNAALEKIKAEYSKLLQDKEKQDMEMDLLHEECDSLRQGNKCGACTIQ